MKWIMREHVDLAAPQGQHIWPDALMTPGDSYAHRWVVSVYQDGVPVDMTGWDIYGYITRCKDDVLVPIKGTATGSEASVVFDPACYAARSELYGVMQAVKGEVRLTLSCGRWRIGRDNGTQVTDPGELIPSLPALLAEIASMRAATEACEVATKACEAATADAVEAIAAAPPIISAASGSVISIADGAARPAQELVSTIRAAQAGSGDPSPDNVRAISGWDTVMLTRTGKNLVSHLDYVTTQGHNATTIAEDVIDVTSPTGYDYGNIPVVLKGGVTYTLVIDWDVYGRADTDTGLTTFAFRMAGVEAASRYIKTAANGAHRVAITYLVDADTACKIISYPNYGSGVPACSRTKIMLLVGSYTADTAPAFVPCDKTTLTATLPETVYGGTLDWATGLLTVTHGCIDSYAGEDVSDGWLSSTGALSTGAQVVYELVTPYTVQLDKQTLTMLKGCNVLRSDCGDTAVTYVADTKMYIDNALAAIAASVINA